MRRDELIEKMARAMCERDGFKWDAASVHQTANGDEPEQQREYWRDKADAALSAALSIEQTEPVKVKADTPAPPHSLPSWGECALAIDNWEFRQRAEAGLEGAVLDTEEPTEPTALMRFIYEYDDSDPYKSGWFMHRLDLAVTETVSALVNAQADADVVERWQPIETAPRDGKHCILAVQEGAFIYSVQGAFDGKQWNAVHREGVEPLCWMPNCRIPSEFLPAGFSSLRPAEVGSAINTSGTPSGEQQHG